MKVKYRLGNHKFVIVLGVLVLLMAAFVFGELYGKTNRGWPFIKKEQVWSIGIYDGSDISKLHPLPNVRNPVLTAGDVSDFDAEFVADPFMIEHEGKWYMFFEVMNSKTKKGSIGLATSADCLHWEYKQIVHDEPFHLSYPYVFAWEDEFYMVQLGHSGFGVVLYKAVDFPTKWSFYKEIIYGDYCDPSIVRYDGKWWLFTSDQPFWNNLHLFYADNLTGPWVAHPKSPVVRNNRGIARPGGRILVYDGCVIRFGQDCQKIYGSKLRAFEVTKLTTEDYEEKEVAGSPILSGSGKGWNADGMHQLDLHQTNNGWIGCVDGWRLKLSLDFRY